MRKTRHVGDQFPPVTDTKVTLIRVRPSERTMFAVDPAGKKELLASLTPEDELLAVWSGKTSHVFDVPDVPLSRWFDDLGLTWTPSKKPFSGEGK